MNGLLTVMGSGETSPTMVKTHRALLARTTHVGPPVLLDTPYGFQENADELSRRASNYFADSVGTAISVASYRAASEVGSVDHERFLTRLREAGYVFAGPGSPTYALRAWAASSVAGVLAERLAAGAAVTFASAAALTLGRFTVPVYEIYKVGQPPAWCDGLDLLGRLLDRPVAVVPHFDNAEGGTHDTRFCYLGARRLEAMEALLPSDAVVLGVDEHTACVFDLAAGTVAVEGRGQVTMRGAGVVTELPSGAVVSIVELVDGWSSGPATGGTPGPPSPPPASSAAAAPAPFLDRVRELDAAFTAALDRGEADAAAAAVLDLEAWLVEWGAETFSADEAEVGRATLRAMVVRLAEVAAESAGDPARRIAPFVDALLALRDSARHDRRFAEADDVRDTLVRLGVEVRDTPEGSEWGLLS